MRARSSAHYDEIATDEPEPSNHLASVHRLYPEKHPPEEEEEELQGTSLVGSLFWTLEGGDVWLLGTESAFLFTDCWRETVAREPYMLDEEAPRGRIWKQSLRTIARRWITGESPLFDLYVAEKDGAELAISSDELGGNLYSVRLERGPIVCRKAVFFGSQKGVMLRVESPLARLRPGLAWRKVLGLLKQTAYGPGWIYQKFVPRDDSDEIEIILQIDGDIYHRDLAEGETLRADPRHSYAWDATVSHRLIKFGGIADRLLRGSIPFQVEFEGPGRVWLSNMSFGDGYLGNICTPCYWVFRVHQGIRNLIGHLNPLS